ncbi:hypothetical protein [Endozoicomonas lisbonensis]|uniref:Chitin-binding type-4 domain-containing protein n=1 Tax=Endozoicomonas lisbonensis TaxID=3120522 RepID=A0ABV2SFB4_9GAMM
MKYIVPVFLSVLLTGEAVSAPVCPTHIKINLISESVSGAWESYAHYSSESGKMVLPNNQCKAVSWFVYQDFSDPDSYIQQQIPQWVDEDNPVTLGHQNAKGGDFWGTITITMTWQPGHHQKIKQLHPYLSNNELKQLELLKKLDEQNELSEPQPPAKTCVFYIAASGPAQPVTKKAEFHGAQCDWSVTKEGVYTLRAK